MIEKPLLRHEFCCYQPLPNDPQSRRRFLAGTQLTSRGSQVRNLHRPPIKSATYVILESRRIIWCRFWFRLGKRTTGVDEFARDTARAESGWCRRRRRRSSPEKRRLSSAKTQRPTCRCEPGGCTRDEVHSGPGAPQLGLIGQNDVSGVANARGNLGADRAGPAPKKSVVGREW